MQERLKARLEGQTVIDYTWIFLVNLVVLTSMKAALTARMKDLWLLKVTRPDPIGYLYLSVSTPKADI